MTTSGAIWWGTFEFDEDDAGTWRIGPCTLRIYRSTHSWHLIHSASDDALDEAATIDGPRPIAEDEVVMDEMQDGAVMTRYSFEKTDPQCRLVPVLADRAVVVQPDSPLYILPDERVTLYVSTPLWVRIEVGRSQRVLQELPTFRPSDTWFGPSTREGELCYSVQTVGRLRLIDLPKRLHRAITPIHIHNRATDSLLIDRIQVPVQYLSLFEGSEHFLWTQALALDRHSVGDQASVRFDDGAIPREAGPTTLLSGPRLTVRANMIVRTFGSLFHRTSES